MQSVLEIAFRRRRFIPSTHRATVAGHFLNIRTCQVGRRGVIHALLCILIFNLAVTEATKQNPLQRPTYCPSGARCKQFLANTNRVNQTLDPQNINALLYLLKKYQSLEASYRGRILRRRRVKLAFVKREIF